jgi:REP element-mobilizing transposase RayT
MPVRFKHDQLPNSYYFITFTCYKWLQLFREANAYDAVYKWFDSLYKNNSFVTGYVIMPNHVHALLYFPQMPKSLNTVIGNAKRFLAYEIIKRLEEKKANDLLDILYNGVKKRERKKGQRHKVFQESFDAKECRTTKFIFQKLDYMHHNPVSKRWQLVPDFTDYEYSSASFYEKGIKRYNKLMHINDALNNILPGSPLSQSPALKTPG